MNFLGFMKNKLSIIPLIIYLSSLVCLFFYSYSQVDLNLTLNQHPLYLSFQKHLTSLGYFHRPLSALIYLSLIFLLFTSYLFFVLAEGGLGAGRVWTLIFLTAFLLWFSYNAFSYDLFNYIFDARILTFYHKNPYKFKALDFPNDPMLRFMHWVHRTYPYGPVWLLVTIPLSILGRQKFLPTMFLFKGVAIASYLSSCWLVFKILQRTSPRRVIRGLVIFALNPLVIIESLVSAHNDIFMIALALLAFLFLLEKKLFLTWLFFLCAGGVKFATFFLFPPYLLVTFAHLRGKQIDWSKIYLSSFFLLSIAVLFAVKRSELQPWYLLYPLSFLPFLRSFPLFVLSLAFSFSALLRYLPFLALGYWDPPVPTLKFWLTAFFPFLTAIFLLFGRKCRFFFRARTLFLS